jgi:hypothetical protein
MMRFPAANSSTDLDTTAYLGSYRKSVNDRIEMRPLVLASLGLGASVVKILRSRHKIAISATHQSLLAPNRGIHPIALAAPIGPHHSGLTFLFV